MLETMRASSQPIVFTHYGYSKYLELAVQCCLQTNRGREIWLIGDSENSRLAEEYEIRHICRWDLRSRKKEIFNDRFRWIQGIHHEAVKNGQDWLRWQWERWFLMEILCKQEGMNEIWHFDSDVMIVEDLDVAVEYFGGMPGERLRCHPNLNGLVSYSVLEELTSYALRLYEDECLLREEGLNMKRRERHAFTEMSCLERYAANVNSCSCRDLNADVEKYGYFFDQAVMLSDGLRMKGLLIFPKGSLKDIQYSQGGFHGWNRSNGKRVRFITVNCSWVPMCVPVWILQKVRFRDQIKSRHAATAERAKTESIVKAFSVLDKEVRKDWVRYCHIPLKMFIARMLGALKHRKMHG